MDNPFLSQAAFVSPSLNRLRVVDLPGVELPGHWRGLYGFDLLSAGSLAAMIKARAGDLELQADMPDILQAFDDCFNSPATTVAAAARMIAAEYGRHLGILLLTLKRADPVNRRARQSWREEHWRFWQSIATIHIGGGLLAGAMGPIAVASARETVRSAGFGDMNLLLSPYAAYLPVAGLAETAPPDIRAMLLFDFGQAKIKRAAAAGKSGKNRELYPLPTISTPIKPGPSARSERELAEATAVMITDVIAKTWLDVGNMHGPLDPLIGLSLACYLRNGHPPPSEMGYYGRMQLLSDNLQNHLAARISKAIDRETQITLLHDGSAAALACAGSQHTAVLMLGTAIGIGFAPVADQGQKDTAEGMVNLILRPLSG